MLGTYDHESFNISLNGIRITDLAENFTVSPDGDDWNETEGLYGSVERTKVRSKLRTVTLPMMQSSVQLNAIETLRIGDLNANAGPFPFWIKNLSGEYTLAGRAWIKNIGDLVVGRDGGSRTVTLRVYVDAGFEGR